MSSASVVDLATLPWRLLFQNIGKEQSPVVIAIHNPEVLFAVCRQLAKSESV